LSVRESMRDSNPRRHSAMFQADWLTFLAISQSFWRRYRVMNSVTNSLYISKWLSATCTCTIGDFLIIHNAINYFWCFCF